VTLSAAVGVGQAVDGREAGLQAAHQALNGLGAVTPGLAFLFASNHFPPRDVLNGALSLLGETPLIGFGSPTSISSLGQHRNAVTMALLAGNFEADAHWFSGYAQSGRDTGFRLAQMASSQGKNGVVIAFGDGFNGDAEQFCDAIEFDAAPVAGCLSSGELPTMETFQLAGNQFGTGSLAAAFVRGDLRVGIGHASGWEPVGTQLRVTRSRGFWLRTLNGRPASETYAQIFGHAASDWAFPPLNYLARLYPLGVERANQLVTRSPIRVEADGSFRMNAPIEDGADAYLLVGSRDACQRAAREASQMALRALRGLKPSFAMVLVDIAWQLLLEAHPNAELTAVRDILGPDIPLAGAYSLGQIVPQANESEDAWLQPRFLNQQIVVIAFAEGHAE
jgi:hypothetical protein